MTYLLVQNRACCQYGENTPTDQCSAEGLSTGALVGIVVGSSVAALLLATVAYRSIRRRKKHSNIPEEYRYRDPPVNPGITAFEPTRPAPSAPPAKHDDNAVPL